MLNVNSSDFHTEVLANPKVVLVDFWAAWCPPCKQIAPHLEKLQERVDYTIAKVDVEANRELATRYNVASLPTFLVFKDGKEIGRKVGTAGGIVGIEKLVSDAVARL